MSALLQSLTVGVGVGVALEALGDAESVAFADAVAVSTTGFAVFEDVAEDVGVGSVRPLVQALPTMRTGNSTTMSATTCLRRYTDFDCCFATGAR